MGWLLLARHVSNWRTSNLGCETQGPAGVAPALREGTVDVRGFLTTSPRGLGNNQQLRLCPFSLLTCTWRERPSPTPTTPI